MGAETGRRAFMAGAAGIAAGAALLGTTSPAGAVSLDDHDFDGTLMAVEGGGTTPVPVGLGTGGAARADFIAEGEIAVMTFRLVLGAEPDPGDDFWAILASDFPVPFQPAPLFVPGSPSPFEVAFAWQGSGMVVDGPNSQACPLIPTVERFPTGPTFTGWAIASPTGVAGLNSNGTVPFVLDEGTIVASTMTYRRIVPEE
jgi:hypothetical protein